jgi:hypothetical protein
MFRSNLSYTLRLGYIYTIMETELLYEPFRPAGPQVGIKKSFLAYVTPDSTSVTVFNPGRKLCLLIAIYAPMIYMARA